MSPYNYAANNPIRFIDPDGMSVDNASKAEWNKQRAEIDKKRNNLQNDAKNYSKQNTNIAKTQTAKLNDRISSLNSSNNVLNSLQKSTQSYAIKTGAGEEGGTTYDPQSGNIVFNIQNTANFIHETTHGKQFECGDFAFSSTTGKSVAQDVQDEVAAYKAQFAYDPSSVSGLTSSSVANTLSSITSSWVQGITKSNGDKLYAPGGSAFTAPIPININSSRSDLILAYPTADPALLTMPANYTIKTDPDTYYKH